ncbi:MAG: hypothetical protein QNJ47_06985 [Nostocaceae cyanobacterium]|nr:hypothetical protein [Nostocaceae cyanobacterium]
MLAQFQSKYPTGNLTSELVQIYHGKYIVLSSVQVDGVTRATGMAAAETLEEAEDRARNRALMVLGITSDSPESVTLPPQSSVRVTPDSHQSSYSVSQTQPTAVTANNNANLPDSVHPASVTINQEPPLTTPGEDWVQSSAKGAENYSLPEMITSNVKQFPQRSYDSNPQEDVKNPTAAKRKKKNEPLDHSDDIAKIGVEMERLNWTTEQGRDYLIQAYGKRSRHKLSPEELRDFLTYLESQPTPIDPLAGF